MKHNNGSEPNILQELGQKIMDVLKFVESIIQNNSEKQEIEKPPQKDKRIQTTRRTVTTPPQPVYNPPSPIVQKNTKHFLVLVLSVSNKYFLELLDNQKIIEANNTNQLMKMTKFIWLASNNQHQQIELAFDKYSVSEIQESPDDIVLLYITLEKYHEGFKPNKNQLDRYDAFSSLTSITDFHISPRLKMEALDVLEFYSL
jgi:hypothetical protein